MKLSVRIIFPPQFEPFQPYLSCPYLKGLLHHYGLDASVCDANIDFYWWLVSLHDQVLPWHRRPTVSAGYLSHHVEDALERLRRIPSTLLEYRWAVNVVDEYLGSVSPLGTKLGLTYLKVGNRFSSSGLREYIDDPTSIFEVYMSTAMDALLGAETVSFYLLSLVVIDQLPAAIAFAREIKRRRPGAQVHVGGPLVSRLHNKFTGIPWIAQSFDAIHPGEAYRILPSVLGLGQRYEGHVTPDFSDLPLDRYWSHTKVLPYLVAHGCRWGKCTFCSHHLTYDGYRTSAMDQVVADIQNLSQKHNAEYVSFCDEYLTPKQLDEFADGVLEREIPIRWSTFARPEPHFQNRQFTDKLYAAGCRMLFFGLESGSQRVLKSMQKGTLVANFRPILRACKESGIALRHDFMVGFPGETEEDVSKTYSFIRDNRDVIDTPFSSYSVAIFELRSGIPVECESERYQIVQMNRLRGDLDDQYELVSATGIDEVSRVRWRERLVRFLKTEMDAELIAPQNKTHQLLLKSLYDEGFIDLPVTRVEPEELGRLRGRLGAGVEYSIGAGGIRLVNQANGGELHLDRRLSPVILAFESSVCLDAAFRVQSLWPEQTFASFVNFLYRNDYLELSKDAIKRDSETNRCDILNLSCA